MNVDVVLDDPLLGDVWVPIEVVQGDFVQGKFELMLRPMSFASDLDDLHKSLQRRA